MVKAARLLGLDKWWCELVFLPGPLGLSFCDVFVSLFCLLNAGPAVVICPKKGVQGLNLV